MEGLRHAHDASEACSYVQVVRVVDTLTYRFPSLSFLIYSDKEEAWMAGTEYEAYTIVSHAGKKWLCAYAHTAEASNAPDAEGQEDWLGFTDLIENNNHRYNENVMVGEGVYMTIYPIDGDDSRNRTIRIKDVDSEEKRLTISIWDKDELGEPYERESHIVGIHEDDRDDMGLSAYIETAFERESERFRVGYMEGVEWESIEQTLNENAYTRTHLAEFAFAGGNAGEDPQIDGFMLGCKVFRNDRISLNLLFAAGIIVELSQVADERRICFFYDVPPGLKAVEAMECDKFL